MKTILLVGAGHLGSRYLQGLCNLSGNCSILVVDPSEAALSVAKSRCDGLEGKQRHSVRFATGLNDVQGQIDLAIIATPANCRSSLVREIAGGHCVNAWLLEKLLAQSCDQLDVIEQALVGNNRVWVNTPRRVMSWHQDMRSVLLPAGPVPLKVRVFGGGWGLACNAIHFIDLVGWWAASDVVGVDCHGLESWHPSKRSGFQEVFGTLVVNFRNGSTLELSCNQSDAPSRIEIEKPEGIWLIEEASGKAVGPSGQAIAGQLTFQSALTAPLVEQILTAGHCELPSLANSAAQHRPLLDALLQHWNHSQSREDLAVPIT